MNIFGLSSVQKNIPFGAGTLAEWTEANGISEADFGLATCGFALLGMFVGSLLLPDEKGDVRVRLATVAGVFGVGLSVYFWWMGNFAAFWGTMLAMVIVLYSLLAVIVSIGGWRDVLVMFKSLEEREEE